MAAPIIRITGISGFNGDYPLDLEEEFLGNDELHELKKETGIRGGEITEALDAGDNDLLVMLAVFAVRRSGKTISPSVVWKAKVGGIEFIVDEEEEGEESLPPPSEPDEPKNGLETAESSGATSELPADPSPVTQLRTGIPSSDTSADSDPETLVG
jgi:hypothetical protein